MRVTARRNIDLVSPVPLQKRELAFLHSQHNGELLTGDDLFLSNKSTVTRLHVCFRFPSQCCCGISYLTLVSVV